MLAKIHKLTTLQVSIIIVILGFAVYFTGLKTPFQGDDILLIVNNIPVHSIANIRIFFEGSTFYNGQGLAPLSGTYYRPLQTTFFSLIYTLFGANVVAFHVFQLLVCLASTIILFLIFKRTFKTALALVLSLIFLVHPLDSQVVFANTHLQDALYFFFGILALWLLLQYKSKRSLVIVAICLLLSILSRESGVLFIFLSLLYLFWFDRKRLYPFIGIMILPLTLYMALRINAIGLLGGKTNLAPIDSTGFTGRLFTMPSIMLFYFSTFLFPAKLATGYFWVYPTFSVQHFLIPLIIDLAIIAAVIYLAFKLRKKVSRARYFSYLFFAVWTFIGIIPYLQIIPIDMTACEAWFYFSMAGLLGMIGVVLTAYPLQLRFRRHFIWVVAALLVILGTRTALRGVDWQNQYTLARKDIIASPANYDAYTTLASGYNKQNRYNLAKTYAMRSISIQPTFSAYYALGVAYGNLGDYAAAVKAYNTGLSYGNFNLINENLGELMLVQGSPSSNQQFFIDALAQYPEDSQLWMYQAIFDDQQNDSSDAKVAIAHAAHFGNIPQSLYDEVMSSQPYTVKLVNLRNKDVNIP